MLLPVLIAVTGSFCQRPPVRRHNHAALAVHDDESATFATWLRGEMSRAPNYVDFPEVYADAEVAILRWRQRYLSSSPRLWRSLMKADRMLKELVEAAPVIAAVRAVVEDEGALGPGERFSIVDLCSGKGFLSMFLSETLDPQKVERCFLVDKQWPPLDWPHDQPILPHHISDAHIYAERGAGEQTNYFKTWPIPLHTSKQDLKKRATVTKLGERLVRRSSGPLLILGIHLCGTLSLRAIDLFNANPKDAALLVLKPCCLPGLVHAKRNETFTIGRHSFDAAEVCTHGRFAGRNSDWTGPPRAHLKPKFDKWTEHLCAGVEVGTQGAKAVHRSTVQIKGGFQNSFIIAERSRGHDVEEIEPATDGAASAARTGVGQYKIGTNSRKAELSRGLSHGLWQRVAAEEMRPTCYNSVPLTRSADAYS